MINRSLKRQKAINYLLKHPDASGREVAKHSGLSLPTVYKLIKQRQTPVAVLKQSKRTKLEPLLQPTEWDRPTIAKTGATLLREAADVFEQRGQEYGPASKSIGNIAALWTVITGHPITPTQAAAMLVGLKLARLKHQPHHRDSIVDIAGYAAVMSEAVLAEQEREANGYTHK